MNPQDYDYTKLGFDGFLERQTSESSGGGQSTLLAYDRVQVGGLLGDSLRMGSVDLSGKEGAITVRDSNNLRVIIGNQSDGSQGVTVSKPGYDADIQSPENLVFNSSLNLFQTIIADSYTFPSITVPASSSINQDFSVNHGIVGGIPGYIVYAAIDNSFPTGSHTPLGSTYYTLLYDYALFFDGLSTTSEYGIGMTDTSLIVRRTIANGSGSPAVSPAVTIRYYIYQQTLND